MTEEKRPYWGYRAVLKYGKVGSIDGVPSIGEDYLVLEEVHYNESDEPERRDGGRHFQVTAEEGVEGMIELLKTAIRHLEERGVLVDPWPDAT